ncbi:MAG: M20/M25/M40 family metallo-hydrolase [Treponema sp.]|jgi:carboxypeptidase PM20D1|nr:M20/M25/M40 family metallo-hydrolase [Treponema sp.]
MTVLIIILALIVLLVAVVLIRTAAFKPPRANPAAAPILAPEPAAEVLGRLSRAISFPTVCTQAYEGTDFGPFEGFIGFLAGAFPLFHKTCELKRINGYALVFCWKGNKTGLKPMILTAHYDVVPVEKGTEAEWQEPGYSGAISGGKVWGRGTLDIKSQLMAHLEAAENLMRRGFQPARDFYFIYGQDEETGGRNGAAKVAEYLDEQGIRPEGVLDEGGMVVSGVLKGVKAPLALIGVAEKGFCNYEMTLSGEGGHSSMPPVHTALGNAARLVTEIEKRPYPAKLTAPVEGMLRNIAGEMGFLVRMAVANLWLFRPLLLRIFSANPVTNSMVRSTFAATMARASDAANVLPQKAAVTVNVRLLPGDTVDAVEGYFRGLAGKVPGAVKGRPGTDISIKTLVPAEASKISPAGGETGPVYEYLEKLIGEFFPNAISSPFLVMGGTDARKYYRVSDQVYRFTPVLVTDAEKNTAHNTNEYITIENYGRMILFYERFIEGFDPSRG